MRSATLVFAAGLVGLAGGCSGAAVPSASPRLDCAGEPTRPLTAPEATRVLRRHGFTVRPEPADVICDAPDPDEDMPVSLSNSAVDDTRLEREGHLLCGLRRGPIWGWKLDEDLEAPPSSPLFSGDKATFSFANLECTLYPRGDRGRAQVRSIQQAVRELARLARMKRA